MVIAEIVWVLESFYELPKNEVQDKVEKILITGTGMLASALGLVAQENGFTRQLVAHSEMDVTDPIAVEQVIANSGANYVFSTLIGQAPLNKSSRSRPTPRSGGLSTPTLASRQ